MNNILELSENINKCSDINKKINMVNELNDLIKKQIDYLENIDIDEPTNDNKYNNKTIEELEELFNNKSINNNIEDKINIYHAINKYYNNKLNELFYN